MPRNAAGALPRTLTDPRDALSGAAREERLARLAGSIARRVARWGWLDVWSRVQRGEQVRPVWHRKMMELTLSRLSQKSTPPSEEMP